MIRRIKTFCEKHQFVELYNDRSNLNRFEVGYIVTCTEDEVLVHSVSPYGDDDGFYWECADDFFSIRYDTDYLNNLTQVMEKKTELAPSPFPKGFLQDASLRKILLDYAMENNRMVRVVANNYDLDAIGEIVDYDDATLNLRRYFSDGRSGENIIVLLEDLQVVSVLGRDEQKTELAKAHRVAEK